MKVARHVRIEDEGVRHLEPTAQSPSRAIRIINRDIPARVIISDCAHTMSTEDLLVRSGHRHDSRSGNRVAFEALISSEAEHDGQSEHINAVFEVIREKSGPSQQ